MASVRDPSVHDPAAGGGERSPVGRTRTAPDGPVDRLRIGYTSCAK